MNLSQPPWLDKTLFPFESKWTTIDGHLLHYIDEGHGDIILFAHGTPEWSFGYRDLVGDLRKNFRCIAMDMLGFGLSEKPADGDFSCEAHAERLEKFIEALALKNITIVANDFGGGIAMSYVLRNPQNIRNVFLFNTWMWSLKEDSHFSGPAIVMSTWFGRMMYLTFNFPVNIVMPAAFGNKKLLTKTIHQHYSNALPKGQRKAAFTFAKELMNASDWWENLWQQLDNVDSRRFFIFWGMSDKFVPPYLLEKWKAKLPNAKVLTFDDAGHFVQEEKPIEMAIAIRAFELENSAVLFAGVE